MDICSNQMWLIDLDRHGITNFVVDDVTAHC